MTFATEKIKSGRQPLDVIEMDLDLCTKTWGAAAATAVAFDDNLAKWSEDQENVVWVSPQVTVADDAATPPAGTADVHSFSDPGGAAFNAVAQTIAGGVLTDNLQYVLIWRVQAGTAAGCTLALWDGVGARVEIDYTWTAGVLSVKSQDTGTGSVSSLGGGWYEAIAVVPVNVIVGANAHTVRLYATENGIDEFVAKTVLSAGAMLHVGSAALEYQFTEALDNSSTNVRLTTSPLTADTDYDIGFDATLNLYSGTGRSGTNYIRVGSDATGESASDTVRWSLADEMCRAAATSGECFNTRATCDFPTDYDVTSSVLTYKFSQAREGIPPSEGIIPCLVNVDYSPTSITVGRGLGRRGRLTMRFRDFAHHDRGGMDPYLSARSYVPEDQGTFWGKFIARNKFYQGRTVRWKSGYISLDGFDLANDFQTRTFFLENIAGPDSGGMVTVEAKDVLKLADDTRSKAPALNTGVLDADINDVVLSATLSPAGIGNSEYAASGTVVIGSETMTFTRAADILTLVRGTDGTTADGHDADDLVQECLRFTANRIYLTMQTLVETYAGVDSSFVTIADWKAEDDDWLSLSTTTALITEPTGVKTLINELCETYMIDIWQDAINSQIKYRPLQPFQGADTITDAANIVRESVGSNDDSKARKTQIWVHYIVRDPTEPLDEARNYRETKIIADTDAQGTDQYGDVRVQNYFSRWINKAGDAIRLASRMSSYLRDAPKKITFTLDAKDSSYVTGDVVKLSTRTIQDEDGSALALAVKIVEVKDVGGTTYRYTAISDAFQNRYWFIGPDTLGDYDAATDEEKRRYMWIAEDTAPQLNGDGPYRIV